MAIVHTYTMTARDGREDDLAAALGALADAAQAIAGSQGAMVLRDRKEPGKFLLLEFWDSEESRKLAGPQLPRDVMAAIMAAQGGPLAMNGYDRIKG